MGFGFVVFLVGAAGIEIIAYTFFWGEGSIAFWDNRSVIHKPVNDYWPALRRMERVTIWDSTTPA